ncbi:unnamed protein product [Candidula unifasciata]|uniref:Uncharacterized protein n=1 Tax=Candidula unifasciata TaxID=100452 RepID=A0A8S3Z738_9EUPU|nr:unnamed protein product [Candidula unifasciata]
MGNCIKMYEQNYDSANTLDQIHTHAESISNVFNARVETNKDCIVSPYHKGSSDTGERELNKADSECEKCLWKDSLPQRSFLDDTEGKEVEHICYVNSFEKQSVIKSVSYMMKQRITQQIDNLSVGNFQEENEQATERTEHFVHEEKDKSCYHVLTPLVDSVMGSKHESLESANISETVCDFRSFPAPKSFTFRNDNLSLGTTIKTSNRINSFEEAMFKADGSSQNPTATLSSCLLLPLNNLSSENIQMGFSDQKKTSEIHCQSWTKNTGDLLKVPLPLTTFSEDIQGGTYSQVNLVMENAIESSDTDKLRTGDQHKGDNNVSSDESTLTDAVSKNKFDIFRNNAKENDDGKNKQSLVSIEIAEHITHNKLSGDKFQCEKDIENHNYTMNNQSSNATAKSEWINRRFNSEIMYCEFQQIDNMFDDKPEDMSGLQLQDTLCAKHEQAPCVVTSDDLFSVNTDLDMKSNFLSDIFTNKLSDLIEWAPHTAKPKTPDGKAVLQKQEQYQRSIRDLITKMEKLNIALVHCLDVPLETGIIQFQVIQHEISGLKEDISQVRCIANQLLKSPNVAAHNAVEATMRMLTDRSTDLETLAENTGRQLQGPAVDTESHKQLVTAKISNESWQKISSSSETRITTQRVKENWDKLYQILTEKKDNSWFVLRTRKPQELVTVSVNAYPRHTVCLRELQKVQRNLVDVRGCWSQLQKKEKQLQFKEILSFQLKYQVNLQDVSHWLDMVEQQLLCAPISVEEEIIHQNLLGHISSLQEEIANIDKQVRASLTSQEITSEDLEKITTTLNTRFNMLKDAVLSQLEELQHDRSQWKHVKDKIAELQNLMIDTEKLFLAPVSEDLDQLLSDSLKIDARIKSCESQIEELRLEKSKLLQSDLTEVFFAQFSNLQCKFLELHEKALEKKVTIQNCLFLHDQYQKLLNEYELYLATVKDKLQFDFLAARDLGHLRQQLTSHKELFDDLEVHKTILDSLASQCEKSTKARFQQQQSFLSNLTLELIDQSNCHGQRLRYLIHQWAEFDEKYLKLEKVLNTIESQMPAQVLRGDSLSVIQEKCKKFKQLRSELTTERGSLFEIVDEGREILHSVTCPTLKTLVTGLADKWIAINDHINCQLKSAETLSDQLSTFETQAAKLTSWVNATVLKLSYLKQLTAQDLQDITTVKAKMEDVLELQKEFDSKQKLKNKVTSTGVQILLNNICDQQSLSDILSNIEVNWLELQSQLSEVHRSLHTVLMHSTSSHQALNEISLWVDERNTILLSDANKKISTATDIEIMVNRYRVYKSELRGWQMMLDFVNQQVLDSPAEELDTLQEKMEYIATLDKLYKDWRKVSSGVMERLNSLEVVLSDWEVFKTCFDKLHFWLLSQEDKIRQYKMIGCEPEVKHALQELQATQELFQMKKVRLDLTYEPGKSTD